FRDRRFGDSKNRVVVLRASVVDVDGPTRRLLLALVIARKVGTDRFPVHAAIASFEEPLAAVVEGVGIMRRNHDRCCPLKAVFQVCGPAAVAEVGIDLNILYLSGALVETRNPALVIAGIDDVRIWGIRRNVTGFASPDVVPVSAVNCSVV